MYNSQDDVISVMLKLMLNIQLRMDEIKHCFVLNSPLRAEVTLDDNAQLAGANTKNRYLTFAQNSFCAFY